MTRSCMVVLVLSVAGCSDLGSEVPPTEQPDQTVVLRVVPDSGLVGSVVAIRGGRFVTGWTYLLTFPGADDIMISDSTKDSTTYASVPFGARSGRITVDGPSWIGRTGDFSVLERVDTLALTVVPYDISPAVTAKDSSVIDRMGFQRTWHAARAADTLHLSQAYSAGEEYTECHLVMVDRGAHQLPSVAAIWIYVKPDYPGSWTQPITSGLLKIQEFNTSGTIAGRFFGRPSTSHLHNGSFTFWVDLRSAR